MKPDKINPIVDVKIAGQSHQLRWDKAALYELGQYPEASAEIDTENGAALFRRACIFAFCMLVGKHPYKSPKDVAAAIADDESEGVMKAITDAIAAGTGGKEVADDPLSRNGPLPDDD